MLSRVVCGGCARCADIQFELSFGALNAVPRTGVFVANLTQC